MTLTPGSAIIEKGKSTWVAHLMARIDRARLNAIHIVSTQVGLAARDVWTYELFAIDDTFETAIPNTGWGMTETNAIGTLIVRRSELQTIVGRDVDTLSPLRTAKPWKRPAFISSTKLRAAPSAPRAR